MRKMDLMVLISYEYLGKFIQKETRNGEMSRIFYLVVKPHHRNVIVNLYHPVIV